MADLPFRRVIYRSRATGGTARADLPAILAQSRLNNGLDGLSGLLWTDGDRYLQLLEGPPESVAATLARILADPRHHDVEFASDTAEAERAFGDWTMADLGADAAEERLAVALADAPPAVKAVFAQAR